MSKQKYYRLTNILKTNAQYLILLGERSNGKAYAVKEFVLEDYFKNGHEFAYIRRWREEIKSASIEQYFEDMEENGKEPGGEKYPEEENAFNPESLVEKVSEVPMETPETGAWDRDPDEYGSKDRNGEGTGF